MTINEAIVKCNNIYPNSIDDAKKIDLLSQLDGRIKAEIYDKYEVEPTNLSCTSQLTGGKKEVTLITCTSDSERRVIVKAREVK